jgi:hypothetical protein
MRVVKELKEITREEIIVRIAIIVMALEQRRKKMIRRRRSLLLLVGKGMCDRLLGMGCFDCEWRANGGLAFAFLFGVQRR